MIKTSEMESNSVEDEEANRAIRIWEVNEDRLSLMHQKISDPPKLLTRAAANSSCCIFKVPQRFIDINGKSYQPHVVSIGPYHHGEEHLKMIEEHKARECYSQIIHFDTDEFIEMMVVDGCFIIELFRKVGNVVEFEVDDPINQIPFFVLECLFDITRMPGEESGPSLCKLALDFFNYALQRPDNIVARHNDLNAKHLLDLVRSSFIDFEQGQSLHVDTSTPMIHSVSKLRRAGIELSQGNPEDSFLVVKFKNGVIEMPTITIDETITSFLLNCVAFEQCHNGSSKHFTTYATLLDCLVNSFRDVEHLFASFINDLGKEVAFDIERCYLSKLFHDIDQYYKNSWHVQWASFKYTYFRTPWSFVSALAALIILLLTVSQTVYTIYGTYK
ncbi:hypothetical protein NC652_013668 [Populus alba x Populus x berolinensis]|nr:hypothetical protein NC652_013668 [Populus alba x Populus x berolinensis]